MKEKTSFVPTLYWKPSPLMAGSYQQINRSVSKSIGYWLTDWLSDQSTNQWIGSLINWLADWLPTDQLADWLWLAGWQLINKILFDWLTDWLSINKMTTKSAIIKACWFVFHRMLMNSFMFCLLHWMMRWWEQLIIIF